MIKVHLPDCEPSSNFKIAIRFLVSNPLVQPALKLTSLTQTFRVVVVLIDLEG